MAIVIEQEKRRVNWFGIGLAFILVAGGVTLIYFLFFAPTPLIEKVAPPQDLQTIKAISEVNLQPETILNDPLFKSLKQYVPPIQLPVVIPRPNPFTP